MVGQSGWSSRQLYIASIQVMNACASKDHRPGYFDGKSNHVAGTRPESVIWTVNSCQTHRLGDPADGVAQDAILDRDRLANGVDPPPRWRTRSPSASPNRTASRA